MKDFLIYGQSKSWFHLDMLIKGKIKPSKYIIDTECVGVSLKNIPLDTIKSYGELIEVVDKIKENKNDYKVITIG